MVPTSSWLSLITNLTSETKRVLINWLSVVSIRIEAVITRLKPSRAEPFSTFMGRLSEKQLQHVNTIYSNSWQLPFSPKAWVTSKLLLTELSARQCKQRILWPNARRLRKKFTDNNDKCVNTFGEKTNKSENTLVDVNPPIRFSTVLQYLAPIQRRQNGFCLRIFLFRNRVTVAVK